MTLAQVGEDLLADVDVLARRIVRQIWGVLAGYDPPRMRPEDLRSAVRPNLEAVLRHLADPDSDDPIDRERARELGATRALQGVPLDAIVQSFRTGERVIVDAMLGHPAQLSLDELRAGFRRLAEGFDQLSSATIDAYRETQKEVTAHYDRMASDLISGLVTGDLDTAAVEEKARLLEFDPSQACQAVAIAPVASDGLAEFARAQRALLAELARGRAGRILTGQALGADVYLIPGHLEEGDIHRVRRALSEHAKHVLASVGTRSEHLVGAGRSCRQALTTLEVVRTQTDHQVLTMYDDVLIDILLLRSDDTAERLADLFYRPLDGRSYLSETLDGYLDCDMSIQRTAESLFVHPNTVAYRLNRIKEVTGFDPRRPRHLMLFWLAGKAKRHISSPPSNVAEPHAG